MKIYLEGISLPQQKIDKEWEYTIAVTEGDVTELCARIKGNNTRNIVNLPPTNKTVTRDGKTIVIAEFQRVSYERLIVRPYIEVEDLMDLGKILESNRELIVAAGNNNLIIRREHYW